MVWPKFTVKATNCCNPTCASILRCRCAWGVTWASRPAEKRRVNHSSVRWLRCTVHRHRQNMLVPGSRKSTKSYRKLAVFHPSHLQSFTPTSEKVCPRLALILCTVMVSRQCGKWCSALQRVGTSPKTQKEREKKSLFNVITALYFTAVRNRWSTQPPHNRIFH